MPVQMPAVPGLQDKVGKYLFTTDTQSGAYSVCRAGRTGTQGPNGLHILHWVARHI